jgi:hypothetical protein
MTSARFLVKSKCFCVNYTKCIVHAETVYSLCLLFVTCFVSRIETCSKLTHGRTEHPLSCGDAGKLFSKLLFNFVLLIGYGRRALQVGKWALIFRLKFVCLELSFFFVLSDVTLCIHIIIYVTL